MSDDQWTPEPRRPRLMGIIMMAGVPLVGLAGYLGYAVGQHVAPQHVTAAHRPAPVTPPPVAPVAAPVEEAIIPAAPEPIVEAPVIDWAEPEVVVPAPAPVVEKAPEPVPAPAAPVHYAHKLPTGTEIGGNANGVESQLVAFIEDPSKQVDKSIWFTFDRLLFRTGSAELDMDKSKDQLNNVAEILKAFPKVSLKVGGYTDSTGSAATNKKLSAQRAQNVASSLSRLGVDKSRLDPEGYGPEHPVCPANDTPECKAQNRRIDLRVTAK